MVTQDFFDEAMTFLRSGYPSHRTSEEQWRQVLKTYFAELGHYPREVFRPAMSRAHEVSPMWFPAVGQLGEIFAAAHASYKREIARRERESRPMLTGEVDGPPRLPDDNPGEILARAFEEESARLRLDPGRASPKHVAKQRLEKIQNLLGAF